jgi:hypothetical protein
MLYSPKLTFVANRNILTGVGLTLGETTCFDNLELITDRFGHLSLSPEEDDSGAVFIGMVHNESPSLRTILKECFDECDAASGERGSSKSPGFRGWNMVTSTVPITTTEEHSDIPIHPDGPSMERRTATKYRVPPRVAAGLSGGVACADPWLVD